MNKRYIELIKEMHLGKCIMIDGATGTELERRGVPQIPNAWNGGGALSHPEILEEVHKEYIELGARIIITNTFATGKHTLEDARRWKSARIPAFSCRDPGTVRPWSTGRLPRKAGNSRALLRRGRGRYARECARCRNG